jgi:hypothetical protein
MNNEQLAMSNERRLYEGCGVKSFELRIMRGEAVKLKLDICGECSPRVYPYEREWGVGSGEWGERFNGDCVTYQINGIEQHNIYGVTLSCKKAGGTKTELWIKRVLQPESDIPAIIEEMAITAQLLRDTYEYRHYGMFRITLKRLVLVSDETDVNSTDAVIGPIRFYVSGMVTTEVFTSGEEIIA